MRYFLIEILGTFYKMNKLMIAGVIATIFLVLKLVEMRYIKKQMKPIRDLIRETIFVFSSSMSGLYLSEQFMDNIPIMSGGNVQVNAFTDAPDF